MATGTPDVRSAIPRHTGHLLTTVRSLEDAAAPSLCEGWSRGHVLTHLARNADGMAAVVTAVVHGTRASMYGGGDARDADIEAGADRPASALLADVEASAARLAAVLPLLGEQHADQPVERTPGDVRWTAGELPLMRLREVVFHHVDLDAGFTFDDVEPDLVDLFLDGEVARLRGADDVPDVTLRTPDGRQWTTGTGTASVSGSPAALLGWLARGLTTGVSADHLPALPKGR